MKFLVAVITALASVAAAAEAARCKTATYRCQLSLRAWDVCNTSGDWVFAGRCPPGTVCKLGNSGSPYCIPRH
ncbi:hypothetical protein V2A60_008545 [Cordyceps javanica]